MEDTQGGTVVDMAVGEHLVRRYRAALSGMPHPAANAGSDDRSTRVMWAWAAAKTPSQYRERLEAENDPVILAELISRAWGTELLEDVHLDRAWDVGGPARMAAVLAPGFPADRVSEWVEGWLEGCENSGALQPNYVLNALALRHKHTMPLLLAKGGLTSLCLGLPLRMKDAAETCLSETWSVEHVNAALQTLEALRAESGIRADVAMHRLGDWGMGCALRQHTHLGGQAPVQALIHWDLNIADLLEPGMGSAESELAAVMAGTFKGTVAELVNLACDTLQVHAT